MEASPLDVGTGHHGAWPPLPLEEWIDTRDTFHMWVQVVGKIRLALAPSRNHWWNVPLYVTDRGLTTSLMPYADGRALEIIFDLRRHVLELSATGDPRVGISLEPKTVAVFYAEVMDALEGLQMPVKIFTRPTEVEDAIPFEQDERHSSYDPEYVGRFWDSLVRAHRAFTVFQSRFQGKTSPVHFFWGAFDLAVSRFSGREAPLHPGGVPNCADWVMQQAYSHEVASWGYWPGGSSSGSFYAYMYPEPPGLSDAGAGLGGGAFYDTGLREFLLPYENVRTAADPEQTILDFMQKTYEVMAELAGWDRGRLDLRWLGPDGTARPST